MTKDKKIVVKTKKSWRDNLVSDRGTFNNPNLTKEQIELDAIVRQRIKEVGFVEQVEGPFGDTFPNRAFIESRITDTGGVKTKFFGCSILYKGSCERGTVDSVATVKRVLMATAEKALKYKLRAALMFLTPKRSFYDFIDWIVQIYNVDLKQKTFKNLYQFSPVPREIIRVGLFLADRIPLEYPKDQFGRLDERELREKVRRFFWTIGTIVQNDNAYYWRVQDPLCEISKTGIENNVRKEILRVFDIAIERENHIKEKTILLKRLASILLLVPTINRIARDYFMEFNFLEARPDDEDIYWASRRHGYNFRGISWQDRVYEAIETDKRLGHVIFGT